MYVLVTFWFSNLSILASGVEVLRVKPGVTETATVEAAGVKGDEDGKRRALR